MALNIKNEETYRLARELAELTGETITEAVTMALKERLERRREVEERLTEMRIISKRCAAMIRNDWPSAVEHGDYLYDERGLPK